MLEKERETMKQMEKVNFKKKLGGCEQNVSFFVFAKMAFVRKIGKHYLCSEGKTRIFVATICFWKMALFVTIQNHQTLQK